MRALLLLLLVSLSLPLTSFAPPPRRPTVQQATLDWLRVRLTIREATARPGNDGPDVAALIRVGGGTPAEHPQWCGFTQAADQRAHGLPIPAAGMQGAAAAWFRASNPRTFYLAGRRGLLDSLQGGDLVGFDYGRGIHHISRAEQVVPALRRGRPPRGFYCLAGNEGRFPNAGLHRTFYPGPNIAAAARWDYK